MSKKYKKLTRKQHAMVDLLWYISRTHAPVLVVVSQNGWSGACIEGTLETYDVEGKLAAGNPKDPMFAVMLRSKSGAHAHARIWGSEVFSAILRDGRWLLEV